MGKFGLGKFEEAVLSAVLRLRSNAYGVTIKDDIEERTGKSVSFGALYTTLDRLEDKGFISTHMGGATPERGGRAKRFVTIKAAGFRALEESWQAMAQLKADLRLAEERW